MGRCPGRSQSGCASQTVKTGIVQAKGCFSQKDSTYTATGDVELNGFTAKATAKHR